MHNFSLLHRLLLPVLLLGTLAARAQGVGIGTTTPDASAVLDISSASKGLLPPRLTEAARLAMGTGSVPAPAPGLLVYQTDGTSTTPGFYYASSATTWVRLTDATTADNRYIQNQSTGAQSGGFRVSGSGSVGAGLTVGGSATLGGSLSTSGSATVGSTITAGGSVQVPAASAYTYAAAKSYTATYGAADFQPETITGTSGTGGGYTGGTKFFYGTGGGTSGEDFTITNNGRAALHLPQGATLVSAVIAYYPVGGTFAIRSATLPVSGAVATTPPAPTTLGSVALTNNSNANAYLTATLTLPAGTVVDNTKAYYLWLGGTVDLIGVRLTYTVTQTQ